MIYVHACSVIIRPRMIYVPWTKRAWKRAPGDNNAQTWLKPRKAVAYIIKYARIYRTVKYLRYYYFRAYAPQDDLDVPFAFPFCVFN